MMENEGNDSLEEDYLHAQPVSLHGVMVGPESVSKDMHVRGADGGR